MRIGSLFSGYGGLDMAVQSVLGGEVAWYSEIEPAACQVLAAHHPEVLNIGDLTAYGTCSCEDVPQWDHLPAIDVLTAGYPCQPFSHAGNRKGQDDERHLWPHVRDAIGALEPRLVVLENVRGHLSMGLADVIGDLAALGYDARWGLVFASDAGAPHGRGRVFIVAEPADAHRDGRGRVDDAGGASAVRRGLRAGAAGHPVPAADAEDERHQRSGSARRRGAGPTDDGGASTNADERGRAGRSSEPEREQIQRAAAGGHSEVNWGKYAPAINRWQRVIGRPAPSPTTPGAKGTPRLSPLFVEWLMGLPEGHVTGHGLTRTAELKMLGNGVVPQQAALALQMLGVRQ